MTVLNYGHTNRLLGYPVDARLLIINVDDFGMCHAVNDAIFYALQHGVLCSTTLMVPCPWALQAMHFLAAHPEVPFGVHLTVISNWVDYHWGPSTPQRKSGLCRKFGEKIEFTGKHVLKFQSFIVKEFNKENLCVLIFNPSLHK